MKTLRYILLAVIAIAVVGCTDHPALPSVYSEAKTKPVLMPDYTDITIPCNICPLNFMIEDMDEVVARISFPGGEQTYGKDNKVIIDEDEWKDILRASVGEEISVEVYGKKADEWKRFEAFTWTVVGDSVDSYLSYRELPPTFVGFEQLAIRQRSLETFEERDIYNTRQVTEDKTGQCINCHSYQNYDPNNLQFHMRQLDGGTMIVCDGKLIKVNIKTQDMISAAVYPSWHPTEKLIAYSTDHTMQSFCSRDVTKVEVQESASDLVLYDIERNEVQTILNDSLDLELFPAWSPDGKWLYYCCARYEYKEYENHEEIIGDYQHIQYNLYRLPFDAKTRTFGEKELIYDAQSKQRSAVQPWASRDGRYLVFAEGPWGLFHIWHPTADIQILDLQTGQLVDTQLMNSTRAESFPSFGSTDRWILYESRRDDGNYTRLYLAYFDREGRVHKGFELPQADPEFNKHYLRSMSRPEFMRGPVTITPEQFRQKAKEPALHVGG